MKKIFSNLLAWTHSEWVGFVAVACFSFTFVACEGEYTSEVSWSDSESPSSSLHLSSSSEIGPREEDDKLSGPDNEISSSSETEPCEEGDNIGCFVDERDGQEYRMVKIGNLWWMGENLNFPYLVPTALLDSSSFCYNDSLKYCETYGRLYLWSAVMDSAGLFSENTKGCGNLVDCYPSNYPVRGICPEGWHLPDSTEWNSLFAAVGGESVAGLTLKSSAGWDRICDKDGNGSDDFAFTVLPAGHAGGGVDLYGGFHYEGNFAAFASSSELDSSDAYSVDFTSLSESASLVFGSKYISISVRCVMDYSPKISLVDSLFDSRDGKTYKTVKLGGREWMGENLNYSYLVPTADLDSSSFCYNDSIEYCEKYGRLYLWSAAMDSVGIFSKDGYGCGRGITCNPSNKKVRGICPEGWHLPSMEEWKSLFDRLGDGSNAVKKIKGMLEIPYAGISYTIDDFEYYGLDKYTYFWASTEDSFNVLKEYFATEVLFEYADNSVLVDLGSKDLACSIRCVRD
ncbi:MAG: hypothetical protein II819_06350 [Fibrobacter sp.]|nr:hypothetical protein [Fibrobacter sp.]